MAAKPQTVVLASFNPGKLAELQSLLGEYLIRPISDWTTVAPAETASSFVENALIKARAAALTTGCAALSDDSGLIVPALRGAPGVLSARYAGDNQTSQAHCDKLLQAMVGLTGSKRRASFYCVIVYLRDPLDPCPIIAEGHWSGSILTAPQGLGGFGYDSIFAPATTTVSAAELRLTEKNKLSHRAQAIGALKSKLAQAL